MAVKCINGGQQSQTNIHVAVNLASRAECFPERSFEFRDSSPRAVE